MWRAGRRKNRRRKTLQTYRFLDSAKLLKLLAKSSLLGVPGKAAKKKVSIDATEGETSV